MHPRRRLREIRARNGGGATSSAPAILSLAPDNVAQGAGATPIVITGLRFDPASTVEVNGSGVSATWVSATEINATVPVGVVNGNPGFANVQVLGPTGNSNIATFAVNFPVPTLSSLSPSSSTRDVSGSPVTVTLNGTGYFSIGTTGRVDGVDVPTSYVSGIAVTISRPITAAGTWSITARNPAPGGGTSGAQTYTVSNAAPVLTSLSPPSALEGSGPTVVTCNGSSFYPDSVVHVNGSPVTTTYVSPTALTFTADTTTAGGQSITVVTPSPGGGTSGAQTFTVTALSVDKLYRDPLYMGMQLRTQWLTISNDTQNTLFQDGFF